MINPHFRPNFGPHFFFMGFLSLLVVRNVPSYNHMQFQGKLNNQIEKMAKNLVSGPILAFKNDVQVFQVFIKNHNELFQVLKRSSNIFSSTKNQCKYN